MRDRSAARDRCVAANVTFVRLIQTSSGTPKNKAFMIADPSGNHIEFKTYLNEAAALERLSGDRVMSQLDEREYVAHYERERAKLNGMYSREDERDACGVGRSRRHRRQTTARCGHALAISAMKVGVAPAARSTPIGKHRRRRGHFDRRAARLSSARSSRTRHTPKRGVLIFAGQIFLPRHSILARRNARA